MIKLRKVIYAEYEQRGILDDFINCSYADTFGEEVPSEFNDNSKFFAMCDRMRQIFNIMHGVNLQTFDERTQQMLMRHSGEDFGKVYNETKIRYLKSKMDE